jgi:hypothetical protein
MVPFAPSQSFILHPTVLSFFRQTGTAASEQATPVCLPWLAVGDLQLQSLQGAPEPKVLPGAGELELGSRTTSPFGDEMFGRGADNLGRTDRQPLRPDWDGPSTRSARGEAATRHCFAT